jgi:hypothetical protein
VGHNGKTSLILKGSIPKRNKRESGLGGPSGNLEQYYQSFVVSRRRKEGK